MAAIVNLTPASVGTFDLLDARADQYIVLVLSASFIARPGQSVRWADTQNPIRDVDEHYGDPTSTSVRYEADLAMEKPFVDVIVNGQAYAPTGTRAKHVIVSLSVGDIRKSLLVTGDRFYRRWLVVAVKSSPRPFERMPIIYERAFGGVDRRRKNPARHKWDLRNPAGVGFRCARSGCEEIKTHVPNIENPRNPTSLFGGRKPVGFGVVARHWSPRVQFAGTYNKKWKEEQCPLLPLDFDPRYYQAAPLDQQSKTIQGGELATLTNMTPEGRWEFVLPTPNLPVQLLYATETSAVSPKLDTVLIEPDEYRVTLSLRLKLRVDRSAGQPQEIIVGHYTKGFWNAKLRKKLYLDRALTHGAQPGMTGFVL